MVYSPIVPVIKLSAGFVSARQPGHVTFELLPLLFGAGDTQQHKDCGVNSSVASHSNLWSGCSVKGFHGRWGGGVV